MLDQRPSNQNIDVTAGVKYGSLIVVLLLSLLHCQSVITQSSLSSINHYACIYYPRMPHQISFQAIEKVIQQFCRLRVMINIANIDPTLIQCLVFPRLRLTLMQWSMYYGGVVIVPLFVFNVSLTWTMNGIPNDIHPNLTCSGLCTYKTWL